MSPATQATHAPHWAAALIRRPYQLGAAGPDAFDCWGLVRHVFSKHLGVQMPVVDVGVQADQAAHIRAAAQASGWRPVATLLPAEHDIALMQGPQGRHVGVMVRVDGNLRLLHAVAGAGVCLTTLAQARLMGFSAPAFWRHADAR